jgi:SAM-dependent methyltransferase
MDIPSFLTLQTEPGQAALRAAAALNPEEKSFLAFFQILRRTYPPELARAALETAILRREAAVKFTHADQMYFTRSALEQASNEVISVYRANRMAELDFVLDLGCSLGADTLALAEKMPVLGIDLDPLRLLMAQINYLANAPRFPATFVRADLTMPLPLRTRLARTGIFFDPARRQNSRRVYSVEGYTPPLSVLRSWSSVAVALVAKISPGVKLDELSEYDAEVEFISLYGDLKEAVLWFGPLNSTARRATILPGPFTLISDHTVESVLREPGAFLYEPDPAVLRAGLVTTLARQLDAWQLDEDIAYLCADVKTSTPFARAWHIEDWFPFQLKRLRQYLRERNVGHVVIKKRGSPLDPEALIHQLKLKGSQQRVVFLTHLLGRPVVIVCYPPGFADPPN